MVVVVNASSTVDKVVFLHNVNGLRAFGCAGQTLRLACTDLVQISEACGRQSFCTFVPVDMHGFVHSRRQLCVRVVAASLQPASASGFRMWRTSPGHGQAGSEASSQQMRHRTKKKFSAAQRAAPQVYNQNLYTRIVVVLTTATFCG